MSNDTHNEPIVLFGPRNGKSLIRLYPELNKDEHFKTMSADDLHFAWLMGIKGSPVSDDMPDNIRSRTAAAKAYEKNPEKKLNYGTNQDYTDEIKVAIKKFQAMSPDARLIAKQMTQKTFQKFQQLLDVDVENDFKITKTVGRGEDKEEITEMDWTGRKQYADSAIKIIESLPELIKKIEEGYGITEKGKTEDDVAGRTINRYHQLNSQK